MTTAISARRLLSRRRAVSATGVATLETTARDKRSGPVAERPLLLWVARVALTSGLPVPTLEGGSGRPGPPGGFPGSGVG